MEVNSDEKKSLFYIDVDKGEQAVLLYKLYEDEKVIDLYHTEVPVSQRGKGLGGILAQYAFEYARANGLKVEPTCTFIQHYLTKHQGYQDLIHKQA